MTKHSRITRDDSPAALGVMMGAKAAKASVDAMRKNYTGMSQGLEELRQLAKKAASGDYDPDAQVVLKKSLEQSASMVQSALADVEKALRDQRLGDRNRKAYRSTQKMRGY